MPVGVNVDMKIDLEQVILRWRRSCRVAVLSKSLGLQMHPLVVS